MAEQGSLRIFPTQRRGDTREDILTSFRIGARKLISPRTGLPFSDTEIAAATAKGSPRYIEADAIDLVLQLEYQRALWLADQVLPARAGTKSLQELHGPTWGLSYLPAVGGSGTATPTGQPGTTFVGSTIIGSPSASVAADESGKRYQVALTTSIPLSATSVAVTFIAIDTGEQTNLAPGAQLRWQTNVPLGADPTFDVTTQFKGGLEAETDAQFVRRLQRRTRHKAGSGNRAELAAWAEDYSVAVDAAFVYACPLYAGTGILVPVARRSSNVRGPTGRVPSSGLMASLTSYLVPSGSPIVPDFGLLIVVAPVAIPSDMVISLSMPVGTPAGWADYQPWPKQNGGTAVSITAITDQTHFQIQCATPLPLGVSAPEMMAWNEATSSFEQLDVQGVALNSGTTYDVVLASAPAMTLATGVRISPWTELADVIADAVQGYFDSLGPGELIDVSATSTDPRAQRAYRFPVPNEEWPYRAGAAVVTDLQDALVGSFVDGLLESNSVPTPSLPSDPVLGPGLIVAGKLMISPL